MSFQPNWSGTKVGEQRDGRPIEWASAMPALVYFGQGDMQVVDDRPIVCTDQDVVARVDRVHRCGTDVKIYYKGRPDQCEESLLDELRSLFGCDEPAGNVPFTTYSSLARGGAVDSSIDDSLYRAIAARINALSPADRARLGENMRRQWGRILGHETLVTVERVGSRVKDLRKGIGYLEGVELAREQVTFEPGDRCVLQSRIAYYDPPPADWCGVGFQPVETGKMCRTGFPPVETGKMPVPQGSKMTGKMPVPQVDVRGVQLLGGNITDLAMNLGGAYAAYTRLTPEIVCSGSAIRIPAGVSTEAAALAEPAACLLDCFQKTTHEVGQDATGSVLVKGVRPGGVTCVIGSGSMALMAAMFANMDDPVIEMGRAAEIVFVVRSREKADFVRRILHDQPIATVVCDDQAGMPAAVVEQYGPAYHKRTGKPFRGFDDVIVCAGDAETVALSHRMIAHTGGRLMMFAGTRGSCSIDSGVWHYGNAGVIGTSGCNTRMLEIGLGLFARRSIDAARLAGKAYTFDDLRKPGGIEAFFADKHLRPCLEPGK
jgi:threonine dehydrogenase-like Zn-dependent dehydrogenase